MPVERLSCDYRSYRVVIVRLCGYRGCVEWLLSGYRLSRVYRALSLTCVIVWYIAVLYWFWWGWVVEGFLGFLGGSKVWTSEKN